VYARDHVPAGRAGYPRQRAKRFWSRRAHLGGDVNLHVRVADSASERLALLFRDWFRAHPEAIPAYASFKRSLAAVTPDLDAYSDVKDPVVDLVITVAETWAASTGWQPLTETRHGACSLRTTDDTAAVDHRGLATPQHPVSLSRACLVL